MADKNQPTMSDKNQSAPKQTLGISSTFAHFKILAELGRGGMGCVYKALDTKLDRTVALKILISQNQTDIKLIQRFLIEARATAKLMHPNIVRVYEVGNEKGISYFTMDCINGVSLRKLIKSKKLTLRKGLILMKKVSEAMYYAHQNEIIHRDLKPDNIMVDEKGEPYVMDFGLAKVLDSDKSLTKTGMIVGTLFYMPPEQAEGQHRKIDQRSDIYSLGAIIYEIVTGRIPHYANSTLTMLKKITQEPVQAPSTLVKNRQSKALDYICLKALAKKRENRYKNANELAQDLESFIQGKPIAGVGQRWTKTYTMVVIGIVVFIGIMYLAFNTKTPNDKNPKKTLSSKSAKKTPINKSTKKTSNDKSAKKTPINKSAKKTPNKKVENKKLKVKKKIDPRGSEFYNNRGKKKQKKKDLVGAMKDLSKAIELNPRNSWAYNERAGIRRKQGDLIGAIEDFSKTIELNPKHALWPYYKRGLIKVELNDLEGAIKDFSNAIKLDPKSPWSYNDRAKVFAKQKKYQKAVADFKKFMELNPKNWEAGKIHAFIKKHSK